MVLHSLMFAEQMDAPRISGPEDLSWIYFCFLYTQEEPRTVFCASWRMCLLDSLPSSQDSTLSFLQPIWFNDDKFPLHINHRLPLVFLEESLFCGTYLLICSCNQLSFLWWFLPELLHKSPDYINPILWKCGGFATRVSSPLLRWQDSRKGL